MSSNYKSRYTLVIILDAKVSFQKSKMMVISTRVRNRPVSPTRFNISYLPRSVDSGRGVKCWSPSKHNTRNGMLKKA